jgi:hypothetical protein
MPLASVARSAGYGINVRLPWGSRPRLYAFARFTGSSVLAVCLLISLSLNTSAHEGPPFPIIVDKSIGPCIISVWTDPDVGESAFFVIINPQPGGAIPADLKVEIGVQPTSGRLAEVLYPAQREDLRDQVQYKALVFLDAQELWRVRVVLGSTQGSGEASATVEATPPGYGRWDLLIYLLPFVAVALLWLRAVLRRRGM